VTAVVVGGSACALLQIAVVLALWRFKSIRPTLDAVLVERIAKPGFGEDVWAGLDRALAEPWDDAEDEAIAVAAASNDDHFALWENEIRECAS
jgi:hypothetical protein